MPRSFASATNSFARKELERLVGERRITGEPLHSRAHVVEVGRLEAADRALVAARARARDVQVGGARRRALALYEVGGERIGRELHRRPGCASEPVELNTTVDIKESQTAALSVELVPLQ